MEAGYLAFLDVLGFKQAVMSYDSQTYIQKYLGILNSVVDHKMQVKSATLNYLVFSDSIIITSKGSEFDCFESIIAVCSRLLFSLTLQKIPIRGSISFGPFERKRIGNKESNIFIAGPALVEAFEMERKQDWIGIALCPSVNRKDYSIMQKWSWKENVLEENRHYKYLYHYSKIPFHSDNDSLNEIDGFAIFPNSVAKKKNGKDDRLMKALNLMRISTIDSNIRRKYSNTMSFYKEINELYPKVYNSI